VGAAPERGGGGLGLIGQDLGISQPVVVVDGGVQVGVAGVGAVLTAGPRVLWPPPSGMLPSFLMSTWTSSPGRSRSYRRMGWPVARSRCASGGQW
jgi:hypothetical protein